MFKVCLTFLVDYFLVKFIRDAESRNELLLAFSLIFLFGCYIGNCTVSYLLYKRNKKIIVEIELVIKDYNAAATSFNKFLHLETTKKKKYKWYKHNLMTSLTN